MYIKRTNIRQPLENKRKERETRLLFEFIAWRVLLNGMRRRLYMKYNCFDLCTISLHNLFRLLLHVTGTKQMVRCYRFTNQYPSRLILISRSYKLWDRVTCIHWVNIVNWWAAIYRYINYLVGYLRSHQGLKRARRRFL
jgi:hypothetical protein